MQTGVDAVHVACHVGFWDDCGEFVERTPAHFGRFDTLVNNAGMSPLHDSLDASPPARSSGSTVG